MTVYFARTGDEVKVGYTAADDPFDREGALQREKVRRVVTIGYVPGDRELEATLLKALSAYRTQGDWHHASSVVLSYVRDVLTSTQAGVIVTREALEPTYDPDASYARLMHAVGEEPSAIETRELTLDDDDGDPPALPPGPRCDAPTEAAAPPEALAVAPNPATLAKTAPEVVERAEALAERPMSASTRRNYAREWKRWCAWCKEHQQSPFPADERAIRVFLTQLAGAGREVATLQLAYYAIRAAHKRFEQPLGPLPKVSALFANLERQHAGRRPWRGKNPLLAEHLRTGFGSFEPKTIREVRDKAVLLIGFAGALRRSELAALHVSDFEFSETTLSLTVRKSKTDQRGKGSIIAIAVADEPKLCPVRAMQAWLAALKKADAGRCADFAATPAFRRLHHVMGKDYVTGSAMSDATVVGIVKKFAEAQGMDPRGFGGHSLRAGLVTTSANNGVPTHQIMATTRHVDEKTVRGYIRNADPAKRALKLF